MEEKSFYDILGVKEDATQDEIKKVYKKLAMKWHPDRFAGKSDKEKKEAEEKFKEITEAYNILSDEQKRKEYDMRGSNPFGNGFNPFGGGFGFGDDGFDPFSGMFGGRRMRQKGEDCLVDVAVSLEDILYGTVKEVEVRKKKKCSHCNGTGSEDGKDTKCPHCNGTGRLRESSFRDGIHFMNESICPHCGGSGRMITNPCHVCHGSGFEYDRVIEKINIPAGIEDGMMFKIEGKGEPAPNNNGINGDLVIRVHVLQNSTYKREGDNIRYELHLNLQEALLGCEKEITCIDKSKVKIKIPKLTKDRQNFNLKGKGLPNIGTGYISGNMIITVVYDIPDKLTKKQEELIKEFYKK